MQSKLHCGTRLSLDYLFYPRSLAVVGVSTDMSQPNGGRGFTQANLRGGFKGPIYPVGSGGGEIFGLKIYPTLKDIPDSIDFVIASVPAPSIPQLLWESAAKGVKAVHMFTAGFSELSDDQGRQLETEIANITRQTGIRAIGPNCLGLYCPQTGLSFCTDLSTRGGDVGYIAQSGGHSVYGVIEANTRGVYFSKVISFGNAVDLNESDFLEYLAADPETKIIAIYIEGVKEADRFARALKHAAGLKPVVVYKSGATPTGARTVLSHTGAIAGSATTWSSLLKQAGAIEVQSVPELVDMVALLKYMSPPAGKNVAIIGLGGGLSVYAADECLNAGLAVPPLSAATSRQLKGNFTEAGKMFQNPIDAFAHGSRQFLQDIIRTVADRDGIDILLLHIPFDIYPMPQAIEARLYLTTITSLAPEIRGRTAVVLHCVALARTQQMAAEVQAALAEAGFPVFPSFSWAANAIAKLIEYHKRR